MIDPTPFPSPQLKFAAIVAKWSLRVVVVFWLIFAIVWVGLHFVIVPRIDASRAWLEQLASKSLGLTVQIGAISAQSNGLTSAISLQNVVVIDAQQQPALRLPLVRAEISSQSLLTLGTQQISITSPELHVRRSIDGQIWVAGIPVPTSTNTTHDPVTDWVLSQPKLMLQMGALHWTDEQRGTPTVTVTGVDIALRHRMLTHTLQLEATPPAGWGERINLSAVFTEPLIGRHSDHWRQWKGQVFVQLPQLDALPIAPYINSDTLQVLKGAGTARAWFDIENGNLRTVTTDVALHDVRVKARKDLEPLALRNVTGRLGVHLNGAEVEYFTESLQFDTADGLHWPGGNLRLQTKAEQNDQSAGGVLNADTLDIAALQNFARRLPLGDALQATVRNWSAHGLVESLHATWQGNFDNIQSYNIQGKVTNLGLSSVHYPQGSKGLNLDFDVSEHSGKASIAMRQGQIDTQGLLEENTIAVNQLKANLQWTHTADGTDLHVSQLQFSNADGQGTAKLRWQSGKASANHATPLGQLDLQGSMGRFNVAALHRYLPKELDAEVRDYVRQSIIAGNASNITYRLKGDLDKFPFTSPEHGEFVVSAKLQDVDFAYAPVALMPLNSRAWPALQQVNAQMEIKQDVLDIQNANGKIAGTGSLQFSNAQATLEQLYGNGLLTVSAEAEGSLPDTLKMVNESPISEMMNHALEQTTATGNANFKIKLALPITEPERAGVLGQIDFNGNNIALMPQIPILNQVIGRLEFTENGLSTHNLQARALGGNVRMQGGLQFSTELLGTSQKKQDVFLIEGSASAAGLRQAHELGAIASFGQFISGATYYSATIGLQNGHPSINVFSNLTGMALNLPEPFAKSAESILPIRFENHILNNQETTPGTKVLHDKLQLNVGKIASVSYIRDVSGNTARVLRGAIAVGLEDDESAPPPEEGVIANVNIPFLNLDAWSQVASKLQNTASQPSQPTAEDDAYLSYLPSIVALRSQQLAMSGRVLNHVVVGGGRSGLLWRANLDATELNGYVEYLQPSSNHAGRLYARLARLTIEESQAQSVETLLDEQPTSIPALDIVIQNFELRGKNLGKVEIEAVNRGANSNLDQPREWRLTRFNVSMPEAMLTAAGNWSSIKATDRRRTALNFKLDINDAGALLDRFGSPGVVRKGNGKVEGQIAWLGSPITLDYANLGGNLSINIERGQFLKAEPGIAKLIGVLSLQSLPRRLTLDFKDVFSEGFSFDYLRGDVAIESGVARTNNLQMKGVNAAVLMEGQADIVNETQSIKVVVIPEINAGSASLVATAINPVVGISTFLAQWILRDPLIEATTQQFLLDGTWIDPKVTRVERKPNPAAKKP